MRSGGTAMSWARAAAGAARFVRAGAAVLAAFCLHLFAPAPALACTVCIAPPEKTVVDHLVAAGDIVLAREDPVRPFHFAPVETLRGSAGGAPIPFLVDTALRRRLAADPNLAVLFSRTSGTDAWQRLVVVGPALRPIVEDVLQRGGDWLRPSGAAERFGTFAAVHDHPDETVRALALAELDRTPWQFLRTLRPRLPRTELRAGLYTLAELPWVSVRLRLLALSPEPADIALLRDRIEAVSAARASLHLAPLALALVEVDGESAIGRLLALYGPGAMRTREERAAVTAALATHGVEGDPSLRAPVLAALGAMLDADPALGPAIAHAFAAMKVWSHADRFFELLMRDAFSSPQDRFVVAAYVATAKAMRAREPTEPRPIPANEDTMDMKSVTTASLGTAVVVAALVSPALAHEAHGVAGLQSGLLHPLIGWDHVAAMVAVGLLGAVLGAPAIFLLPIVFPLVMAVGGGLGVAGVPLPAVEVGIAASAVVLGLMVAAGRAVPVWTAAVVVAFFAIFHGHAHGTELPEAADALAYGIGFVIGTGLLHLAGIAIGLTWRWDLGKVAVRAAGGVIAVAGVAFLTGAA